MFKKGSKAYSIFNNKCPQCNEGDFYVNKSPFHLKDNLKIYDYCSHCKLKYMMEPSFYYGAMYVTYGLTVIICVATFIISFYLFQLNLVQNFISIIIALIVLSPISLRLSRLIWINLFVKYNPHFKKSN